MPGISNDGSDDLPWEGKDEGLIDRPNLERAITAKKESMARERAAEKLALTLPDELYRKTFETIHYLVNSVRIGRMTEEQFSTGIDTLFMAVCGVCPDFEGRPKFLDVITACKDEATRVYPTIKRAFYSERSRSFKVFTWQAGDDYITVNLTTSTGQLDTRVVKFNNAAEARDKLAAMATPATMAKLGFKEV